MRINTQQLRLASQLGFLTLLLRAGWEFHRFIQAALAGAPLPQRPPAAEGFLPISSLMSLKLLALTGELHPAHPAGVFILLGALAMSFSAPKSFCGWLCPFGLLSELLYKARRRLKAPLYPPAWLHYPLASLKYLLLGFFAWAIASMDAASLRAFLDSSYNLVADAKMYFFFARLSPLAACVIGALLLLSLALPYFWCRYLCPYGALLVPAALAAPLRVRRDPAACTACGRCATACPQGIAVNRSCAVRSENCVSCARCVEACPSAGALGFRLRGRGPVLRPVLLPLATALVFLGAVWLAMLGGSWESGTPPEEYRRLVPRHGELGHP